MKINWFVVIAQIINFLILVWLLKRYLYKPILDAIDKREKKIATQLQDADAKKEEATQEREEFNQKNVAFDQKKEALMNQAIEEANEKRQQLLEDARNAVTILETKLQKSLEEKQVSLNREISEKIQQQVFSIARKTLADIASTNLEKQAVTIFIKHLNELEESEKEKFISAFKSGPNSIIIQTAFDLPEQLQVKIQKQVTEILGSDAQFQFKTAPKLISGIELSANGYSLSWNISKYITSVENTFSITVNENQNKN